MQTTAGRRIRMHLLYRMDAAHTWGTTMKYSATTEYFLSAGTFVHSSSCVVCLCWCSSVPFACCRTVLSVLRLRRACSHHGMEGADSASRKVCSNVTEVFHTLANEPSLGLYYVMEHIQRSVPALVADKQQINQAAESFRGASLDAGFALEDMTTATSGSTSRALDNVLRLAEASQQSLAQAQNKAGTGAAAGAPPQSPAYHL